MKNLEDTYESCQLLRDDNDEYGFQFDPDVQSSALVLVP